MTALSTVAPRDHSQGARPGQTDSEGRRGGALWALWLTLALVGCDPPPPTAGVCFEEHLLPLIAADCAICHENGEYGLRLRGEGEDLFELSRYLEPGDPEASELLDQVSGQTAHPPIWTEASDRYLALLAWIVEGALPACDGGEE